MTPDALECVVSRATVNMIGGVRRDLSGGGIVRRSRLALLLVSAVAAMGLVTACGGSSEKDAQTPPGAATVVNSAAQTDSKGKTVTAPASTAPATPATTSGGTTPPPAAAGDAVAGATVFAANCTACHLNNGKDAGGVGPKLAGAGLDATAIKNQVTNGGGAMPPGLVSGTDLDNVTAYVLSLQ